MRFNAALSFARGRFALLTNVACAMLSASTLLAQTTVSEYVSTELSDTSTNIRSGWPSLQAASPQFPSRACIRRPSICAPE